MGIEFVRTHSNWLAPEIGRWIDDALNPASNLVDVEQRAQNVLDHLQLVTSSTTARYRFQSLTKREEVFKAIFDRVFEQNPDRIIAAAESLHPSRTPFYPLWKRVCWIQIPTTVADILDNRKIKCAIQIITVSLCCTIYGVLVFVISYNSTLFFQNKNIPLRMKEFLACHMVGRLILIKYLPEIPYITQIARRVISPLSFFIPLDNNGPLVTFVLDLFLRTNLFFVELCEQTSYFIRGRAAKADTERLVVCKAKTYEVWKTVILTNAPAAV